MDLIKTTSELADILNTKNLSKINVKIGDKEICVEAVQSTNVHYAQAVQTAPVAVSDQAAPIEEKSKNGKFIKSPIIGTFYSKPAPDKPPFVDVGDKVKKGQVVCIVESMKLMNEINSEFDGTVAAVLAMDGDAVDFGKELIEIV